MGVESFRKRKLGQVVLQQGFAKCKAKKVKMKKQQLKEESGGGGKKVGACLGWPLLERLLDSGFKKKTGKVDDNGNCQTKLGQTDI